MQTVLFYLDINNYKKFWQGEVKFYFFISVKVYDIVVVKMCFSGEHSNVLMLQPVDLSIFFSSYFPLVKLVLEHFALLSLSFDLSNFRNAKNMPDAVRDEVKNVIIKYGQLSHEEAQNYMKKMDQDKRYQAETWS